MRPKDKKRIRHIKTLQHLARKHNTRMEFRYEGDVYGFWQWHGEFFPPVFSAEFDTISVVEDTFTDMVRALHSKVRTEL